MSAFDAYIRLDGSLDGSITCDEPMARHTTYRIGGPAALYLTCETFADLSLSLETLAEEEVEWVVVGRGSNLLVSDGGYSGAIVVLGKEFSHIDFGAFDKCATYEQGTPFRVTVGAAALTASLVQKTFAAGLSGLEFAVGTPGTIGGALAMNAGNRDVWISSIVESVTTYSVGEGLRKRYVDEFEWGYRTGCARPNEVIVECCLVLKTADKMMLHASMEAGLKRRKASQPLNQPSCGSVFRNPQGQLASQLIEECGLKGLKSGGAQVSPMHANFIVNTGSATAADVANLIRIVRDKVKGVYDVELKPEVKFIGFS